ncbi:MAG: type II toxin-antitoxin system VapC family toxin [Desulfurispora sp.]|uniref:type II toxin-antitoxin system VapC family toxin n=1 Tax=Desulfurispora sp. TaxID=3014275 RepID=UPI00404A5F39
MSEKFLIDTSVWIEALRPGGNPKITGWLRETLLQERAVLAPPIKAEILIGARSEKQFAELDSMLQALPLLTGEDIVWEKAARLGYRLRRQGLLIPMMDLLIATWAMQSDCTLVHRDKHYDLLAGACPSLKAYSLTSS